MSPAVIHDSVYSKTVKSLTESLAAACCQVHDSTLSIGSSIDNATNSIIALRNMRARTILYE